MELFDLIKSKREALAPQSIRTYCSHLKGLFKKLYGVTDVFDYKRIEEEDTKAVLEMLNKSSLCSRKSVLTALVVAFPDIEDYRNAMNADNVVYRGEIQKQEKTEKQKNYWVTQEEVNKKYKQLERQAKPLLTKENRTVAEFQQIQNWVIIALLGGVFICPRRNLDYTAFKLRNIDEDKDNYMTKKHLVFNTYKTAKTYGQQKVELPTKLKNVLNKWMKVNTYDHLLLDNNYKELGTGTCDSNASSKLNQRMTAIFPDKQKVGINAMRHMYLTENFGQHDVTKMKSVTSDMGTSVNMIPTYVKKD
jgi:hypothetical protein